MGYNVDFEYSSGWLANFKDRFGITIHTVHDVREFLRQFERKTQTSVDLEEFPQFDNNGETGI